MDTAPPLTEQAGQTDALADIDPAARSLTGDLRQLAERGRTLAVAEAAYQKARATYAGREIKTISLLGVFAFLFVFFALMALTVGLVIALTPVLTAWGATAAVAGGLIVLALLCALTAASRWRAMIAAVVEPARDGEL